jgi:hypothetical protein
VLGHYVLMDDLVRSCWKTPGWSVWLGEHVGVCLAQNICFVSGSDTRGTDACVVGVGRGNASQWWLTVKGKRNAPGISEWVQCTIMGRRMHLGSGAGDCPLVVGKLNAPGKTMATVVQRAGIDESIGRPC